MAEAGGLDISVVTATFRRPALVVESVRSALAQEGVSVEVIVVDDDPLGSAKGPVEAIGDARVRYLHRAEWSGGVPAIVYNQGLQAATGRAVIFLDDDDLALPGAFQQLLAALDEKPDHAFAFGLTEPFGGPPEVMIHETAFFYDASRRARAAKSAGTRHLLAQLLFGSTLFVIGATIFRREALVALGGFRPAVRIQPHTDVVARMLRSSTWAMVDAPVVRYRVLAGSLMHDQKNLPDLRTSFHEMYRGFRASFGLIAYARLKLYARSHRM